MDLNCEKTVQTTKSLLRAAMRQVRRVLGGNVRVQAEAAICKNVLNVLEESLWETHSHSQRQGSQNSIAEQKTCCVAVYLAKSPEASIDETIRVLISRGTVVCAPCECENGPQFAMLSSLDDVKINQRGVREPTNENIITPSQIDVILIPGLAFDVHGARLGQGGGWYDCALQAMPGALKIGVCFDVQIVENVPQESHDIRMDFVVTESCILNVNL